MLRKDVGHTASPPEYRRGSPYKFSCRTSLSKRGRGADTELFKTLYVAELQPNDE